MKNLSKFLFGLIFLTFSLPYCGLTIAAARSAPIEVRAVSVHLLLSPSGEFSEDITELPAFSSWNFRPIDPVKPVNERERFDSYIIKIRFGAAREVFQTGKVGEIVLRSIKTKKVLFTSSVENLYIGESGETVLARLVQGHVCEPVEIVASTGKSKITKRIDFACGE
jgi:hypothetical protein